MISDSGTVEAMLRGAAVFNPFGPPQAMPEQHQRVDRMDPMQNQLCRVCEEPAAGFHFGAFTCEGCKSFFGRTCNNQSVIQECKNNYRCVVDKKNRTACKACRLRKCLMVGMSKSGSRYGRRSNWFKIHCLMQQAAGKGPAGPGSAGPSHSPPAPPTLAPANSGPLGASLPMTPPPQQSLSSLVIPQSHKSSSLSPTSPPAATSASAAAAALWSKTAKELLEHQNRASKSPTPTMVPPSKPSVLPPSSPPHEAPSFSSVKSLADGAPSPFHALFQASSSSISPSSSSPMSPPPQLNSSKPTSPSASPVPTAAQAAAAQAAAAAAAAFQHHPLSSLYGASAFPHLGLMSTPGFPGLPLHKQMLLSPLLAQSHLWQQMAQQAQQSAAAVARQQQYPSPLSSLFGGAAAAPPTSIPSAVERPQQAPAPQPIPAPKPVMPAAAKPEAADIMAEHKALMERFASQMSAMAAAAAAQQAAKMETEEQRSSEDGEPLAKSAKTATGNPNFPMDLSSRVSGKDEDEEDLDVGNDEVKKERDDENEEDVSSFKKIVIKSDLNRNTVVQDSDKE